MFVSVLAGLLTACGGTDDSPEPMTSAAFPTPPPDVGLLICLKAGLSNSEAEQFLREVLNVRVADGYDLREPLTDVARRASASQVAYLVNFEPGSDVQRDRLLGEVRRDPRVVGLADATEGCTN
jgi:hypothetical protein